jgi:putative MATE family efflux protein
VTSRFRPTYRNIWGVSYPLIIAGISETVVDVTDTVFLAHYGMTELGAIALADAIYALALFMTLGLVDGIQISIGRRAGEGRPQQIGAVFNQGLSLLLIAAVLLILAIKFLVPLVTGALFASEAIHVAVDDYLQIAAYGLLFHSFNLALSTFYIGISRTRVLIGATLTLAVTNIALDYALIFGNWGFPELGIEGAGYASLTAEIAVSVFLLVDVLRRRYVSSYGLLRFGQWDMGLVRRLLVISTPVSLETLVATGRWLVFFALIEQVGEQPLAQANIIYSCYALFLIPVDAFSETVCSMTSNLIGQHRVQRLLPMLRRSMVLTYLAVVPVLVLSLVFPEQVIAIFSEEPAVIAGTLGGLVVAVLVVLIAVPAEMLYSAVAGTGDTRALLAIQSAVTLVTLLGVYLAAVRLGMPLGFVWAAEGLGWLTCLLLSGWWLRSARWRRARV